MTTTWVLKRYNNEVQTSEMFSTAGRTVKSGLVASAVVSSWTWAATLLQSSGVAYRYGVSGPFWYASGATVQILLFATLAIELKRRAPNAHTFLEVIRARYGLYAHLVFIVFGLMTNILVTAMVREPRWRPVKSTLTLLIAPDWWLGCGHFVDGHAHCCRLFPASSRCGHVYHHGRHSCNILHRYVLHCIPAIRQPS